VKRSKLKSNPTSSKGKTILKENDPQREEDSSQRFLGGIFTKWRFIYLFIFFKRRQFSVFGKFLVAQYRKNTELKKLSNSIRSSST
jgi:hypothetical protein